MNKRSIGLFLLRNLAFATIAFLLVRALNTSFHPLFLILFVLLPLFIFCEWLIKRGFLKQEQEKEFEKKRREEGITEALKAAEHKKTQCENVLDVLQEGVMCLSKEQEIISLNRQARLILGASESIEGKNAMELLHDRRVSDVLDQIEGAETGFKQAFDIKNGADQILRVLILKYPDCESDVKSLIILYDVSEMRQLEGVRRDFIANVSHELKTPLTSIQGFVETLLAGAIEDREKSIEFLNIIQEDGGRLKRLIEDIMQLSKVESGSVSENVQIFPLQAEIKSIASLLQIEAKKRNIRVILNIPEDLNIRMDKDDLKQIMINLIDNSIKFSPDSGEVRVQAFRKGEDILEISVEDQGQGIKPENLERIFERFYREDKARSRRTGGTGLGLSIVKFIAESYGGRVSCESEMGKGSRFILHFSQTALLSE